MKRSRLHVPFVAVATALFLVVSLDSTPSDTAPSDPASIPGGLDERPQLRELAATLTERPAGSARLQVFTPGALDAALSPSPSAHREFELFASNRDEEARRKLLQRLPYGRAMARAAQRHEVDGLLLAAIVETESRFSAGAVSPRGARGLMQILPATGEIYGASDLLDPYVNLDVGSRYLRSLMREYDGDLDLVLAAYNAGPAVVSRYGGIPPFRETRAYVSRVRHRYAAHCESVRKALMAEADPPVTLARETARETAHALSSPLSSSLSPRGGFEAVLAAGPPRAIRAR